MSHDAEFVDWFRSSFPEARAPYEALERVLKLRPAAQRKLLRLAVWCENSKCTPVRVFELRDGQLVQCRSDANTDEMREQYPHLEKWSRRRAFFLSEWFGLESPDDSHLQVVCDCQQTKPRLVDVRRLAAAIPAVGEPTRNIALALLAPTVPLD